MKRRLSRTEQVASSSHSHICYARTSRAYIPRFSLVARAQATEFVPRSCMGARQLCPMAFGIRNLLAGSVDCKCSDPFGRCHECSLNRKIACSFISALQGVRELCLAGCRQDAVCQMTCSMRGLQCDKRCAPTSNLLAKDGNPVQHWSAFLRAAIELSFFC